MPNIIPALQALAVPIASLHPDPANARKHNDKNLDAIKASLAKFGQRKPVVVQREGMIVRAGNGTLAAAKALGWTEVAAVVLDDDNATASQFAIADNRTAELAEWDNETLASLLDGMDEQDRKLLGFDADDMQELIGELTPEIVEDEVPEPPAEPITKPGDLWLLGNHRLLCGDSTKAEDLARLMGGEKADLIHADPPYGMSLDTDYTRQGGQVEGNRYMPVIGDDRPFDASNLVGSGPKEQLWWGADYYRSTIGDGGSWCAWDKWCGKLEPVGNGVELLWSKQPHKRRVYQYLWSGITAKERTERRVHPTQKPVALTAKVIEDHAPNAHMILDPFLGSGTTLIAAEQLGRKCYGMEISPAYCDVIVKRWETLTGKKAVRADG